jgi:DNA-binding transcriptional MerR regulator
MLNDVLKNLKGQPTSNVKAILDLIFNFIPYTKTNKTDGELINYNDNNYVQAVAGSKTKNVEIRRLIRDIMLKFVHDNSIKYLGEDLYPKTYNEAKQYFNIEKIGQQVAEKETDENKSRLDKRQKIIDTNIRNSAEHEAKVRQQLDDQRAQVLAEKRAKKAKEDAEKQAKFEKYLDEIAQFLYDNTTALIDYINDKSVFGMVSKYIGNPRDIGLDKVASEIDYNSNITRYIQDKLSRILGVNAVNELQTKLAHTSDLTALKSKLTGTSNGLNVFNYIINELNPRTEAEVLDILKVSNDKALRKSLASKL